MLQQSANISYVDYDAGTMDAANKTIEQVADKIDVIVVTGSYNRSDHNDTKPFIVGLKRFGKPVILISNNPYEFIVPPEIDTVLITYSLLHDCLLAASRFLYES